MAIGFPVWVQVSRPECAVKDTRVSVFRTVCRPVALPREGFLALPLMVHGYGVQDLLAIAAALRLHMGCIDGAMT